MDPRGAPYITIDPATGQELATYPDGTVVVLEADATPAPQIVSEGAPNAVQSPAGTSGPVSTDPLWFATDPATGDASLSGSNGSGGYARGGYRDYGSSGSGGGYDDDYVPPPTYGDRTTHPWFGGDYRTPGGYFNAGDRGYDERPQLGSNYVPSPPSYGGSADRGGGGGASPLYYQMKAKMEGMLGGGSSGGYSSDSSYGGGAPKPEKMRGEYAKGLNPTQAAGLSLRPQAMIPNVWGGLSGEMPIYQRLAALPAAQLAMLRGGYSGSTEDLANNLGKVYEAAGKGNLPSTQKMFGQLANSKGIAQMFEGQKAGRGDMESYSVPGYAYGAEPLLLGEASTAFGGLLDAALINEPLLTQAKYGSAPGAWGSYLTDKWGSKALGRKPGRGPSINSWVTKRIFR